MALILEQTGDEFKTFVTTMKSMIGSSNNMSIENERIISSIIGGVLVQDLEGYPNISLSKVKESINIMSALCKLKLDHVIWSDDNMAFYGLKIFYNQSDTPITIKLQKSDVDIAQLEVPDLSVYNKVYGKVIDKVAYDAMALAIKEFTNNDKSECWLELNDSGQLASVLVSDQVTSAEIRFPVEGGDIVSKMKMTDLYDGKSTGEMTINILNDKRHEDRYLIITYPVKNDRRKCLRYAELHDDSINFF